MVCRGVCHKFKAKWGAPQFRYANGQKRCNECELFVIWMCIRCPCCSRILRVRPRVSRYRQKYITESKGF